VPAPAPAPQVEPADAPPAADSPLADPTAQFSFDPEELRKDFEAEPLASVTQLHGDDSSGVIGDMDDDEADEVARQLAKLSPRAAQAVAAAAAAETQAERDAALEALDETDDTVNRSLLLKFLGSVKG